MIGSATAPGRLHRALSEALAALALAAAEIGPLGSDTLGARAR